MDYGRICGHRLSNVFEFQKSTNFTRRPKATRISVRRSFLLFIVLIVTVSSVNIDSQPGACGFYSLLVPRALGSVLVRFDPITMEPIRNEKTRLCVRCKPGERGLLLGMISNSILHAFDGYVNNQKDTTKKIVEHVYKIGDRAFNTGKTER